MGYYGGIGGRLVWQSDEMAGIRQPPPSLALFTNTIECHWAPSLTVTIDTALATGDLSAETGRRHRGAAVRAVLRPRRLLPGRHRHPAERHHLAGLQPLGRLQPLLRQPEPGPLLHPRPAGGNYADRARIVSFDRPYDHDWASGAADFVGNEFPVIYQAEQLGLDVTYWTDVDLHAQPQLLTTHRALISLGHDEYWSAPMRDGATQALAAGVNLAFLGANACYRQIRFEPSPLGANRHQICYKSAAEDPMLSQDPALVTVNWPQAPVSRPEAELIGSTYQDIGAQADLVITDPTSWVLAGVGLPTGPPPARAWSRGSSTATSPAGAARPTWTSSPTPSCPTGGQLLRRDLVHGPRRWRRLRHRQRQLGRRHCPTAPWSRPTWSPTPPRGHRRRCCGSWRTSTRCIGMGPASLTQPVPGQLDARPTRRARPRAPRPTPSTPPERRTTYGRRRGNDRPLSRPERSSPGRTDASRAGEGARGYPLLSRHETRRTVGPSAGPGPGPVYSLRVMGWSSRSRSRHIVGQGGRRLFGLDGVLGGQVLADPLVDLGHQLRVLGQEGLDVLPPWPSCSPS